MKPFDEYWKEIVPLLWEVEDWDNQKIKAMIKCAYEAGRRTVQERYSELLYAVERKWPDETRHQTALRYIKNAEDLGRSATQVEQG